MEESILDKVIDSQRSAEAVKFNPQEIIGQILKNLNPREGEVLSLRYGFKDNQKKTLEEIGKKFQVTRERIRQLENSALKKVNNLPALKELLKPVLAVVNRTLEMAGGIMHEASLVKQVLVGPGENPENQAAVNFMLSKFFKEKLHYIKDDGDLHPSWKLPETSLAETKDLIRKMIKLIEKSGNPLSLEHLLDLLKKEEELIEWQEKLDESVLVSLLEISTQLADNPFKEWGLKGWNSILLKRMSDKIYLVLKRNGKPMHFTEIAKKINELGISKKQANPATINNELILDEKFVLVGRGIYALAERGYKPGVVTDVINEVLKKAGKPLSREEIIEGVLAERLVKRSTVVLALMNKQNFQKTQNGEYTIA